MSIHVNIKNFKSLGETSVLISGFTIIVGTNNFGKSNLWRAIHGVFHNTPGSNIVREGSGESCADVQVTFEDGNSILWQKGDKINRYEINGVPLEKVGRGAPEEVTSLGIGSIEIAGESWSPQFARQISGQIFMLDKPGSVLAEAISDVDSVARINGAMKLSEKDKRTALSNIKIRKEDLMGSLTTLKKFDELEEYIQKFSSLQKKRKKLCKDRENLRELKELQEQLESTRESKEALEPFRDLKDPEVQGSRELFGQIVGLGEIKKSWDKVQNQVKALQGVKEWEVPDSGPIVSLFKTWRSLSLLLEEKNKLLSTIKEEGSQDLIRLRKDLEELNFEYCNKICKVYIFLSGLSVEMNSSKKSVDQIKEDLLESESKLQEVKEEVSKLLSELGTCPVCGKVL